MKFKRTVLQALLAALALTIACSGHPTRPLNEAEKWARIETMYAGYKNKFPNVPDLTVPELLAMDGEPVVLVDVRRPAEQEISMIPGAITRKAFEADPDAWAGHRVVTYCTVGYRSGLYAAELRGQEIDAVNLAGSLLAWTHARQPLEDASGPTQRLHVFGARWNLVAEGYEAVW